MDGDDAWGPYAPHPEPYMAVVGCPFRNHADCPFHSDKRRCVTPTAPVLHAVPQDMPETAVPGRLPGLSAPESEVTASPAEPPARPHYPDPHGPNAPGQGRFAVQEAEICSLRSELTAARQELLQRRGRPPEAGGGGAAPPDPHAPFTVAQGPAARPPPPPMHAARQEEAEAAAWTAVAAARAALQRERQEVDAARARVAAEESTLEAVKLALRQSGDVALYEAVAEARRQWEEEGPWNSTLLDLLKAAQEETLAAREALEREQKDCRRLRAWAAANAALPGAPPNGRLADLPPPDDSLGPAGAEVTELRAEAWALEVALDAERRRSQALRAQIEDLRGPAAAPLTPSVPGDGGTPSRPVAEEAARLDVLRGHVARETEKLVALNAIASGKTLEDALEGARLAWEAAARDQRAAVAGSRPSSRVRGASTTSPPAFHDDSGTDAEEHHEPDASPQERRRHPDEERRLARLAASLAWDREQVAREMQRVEAERRALPQGHSAPSAAMLEDVVHEARAQWAVEEALRAAEAAAQLAHLRKEVKSLRRELHRLTRPEPDMQALQDIPPDGLSQASTPTCSRENSAGGPDAPWADPVGMSTPVASGPTDPRGGDPGSPAMLRGQVAALRADLRQAREAAARAHHALEEERRARDAAVDAAVRRAEAAIAEEASRGAHQAAAVGRLAERTQRERRDLEAARAAVEEDRRMIDHIIQRAVENARREWDARHPATPPWGSPAPDDRAATADDSSPDPGYSGAPSDPIDSIVFYDNGSVADDPILAAWSPARPRTPVPSNPHSGHSPATDGDGRPAVADPTPATRSLGDRSGPRDPFPGAHYSSGALVSEGRAAASGNPYPSGGSGGSGGSDPRDLPPHHRKALARGDPSLEGSRPWSAVQAVRPFSAPGREVVRSRGHRTGDVEDPWPPAAGTTLGSTAPGGGAREEDLHQLRHEALALDDALRLLRHSRRGLQRTALGPFGMTKLQAHGVQDAYWIRVREQQRQAARVSHLPYALHGGSHASLPPEVAGRRWDHPAWGAYADVLLDLHLLTELRRAFHSLDPHRTGRLDAAAVGEWCAAEGFPPLPPAHLTRVLRQTGALAAQAVDFWGFLGVALFHLLALHRRDVPLADWLAFCAQGPSAGPAAQRLTRQPLPRPWHRLPSL